MSTPGFVLAIKFQTLIYRFFLLFTFLSLNIFNAQVRNAVALNRQWPNLTLNAKLVNGIWQIQAKSPRLEGQVQYIDRPGFDLVKGKLSRLNIPESSSQLFGAGGKSATQATPKTVPLNSIPELDLVIDQLSINQYKPGAVVIKTLNTPNKISIQIPFYIKINWI